jgi:hypothetical protein
MSEELKYEDLGKRYPDGRLDAGDNGAIEAAIYVKDGRLVIDFGKQLSWLGFEKKSLRGFIDALENKYKELI